jgi:hypothetical protein
MANKKIALASDRAGFELKARKKNRKDRRHWERDLPKRFLILHILFTVNGQLQLVKLQTFNTTFFELFYRYGLFAV